VESVLSLLRRGGEAEGEGERVVKSYYTLLPLPLRSLSPP